VVLSFLLACLLDSPRRVPFLGFELIMPVAFGRDQFSPWRKFHVCMYVCMYIFAEARIPTFQWRHFALGRRNGG
jgi:hypothetical protein